MQARKVHNFNVKNRLELCARPLAELMKIGGEREGKGKGCKVMGGRPPLQ